MTSYALRGCVWCTLLVLVLTTLTGCAAPKSEEKPKLITEAQVREKLNPTQTSRALAALGDPAVREPIDRYFARRSRELQPKGLKLAVDRALLGEDVGIGDGLALRRVFVLFHQYNDSSFDTQLAAFELVGGAVRLALTAPVGGSGRALATLDEIDLDRAILSVTTFGAVSYTHLTLPTTPYV